MPPGESAPGAKTVSGWTESATIPRVLILTAAALVLTNIPLTHYGTGHHPGYFWPFLSVLVAVWQLWDHRWLAWAVLAAATAVALPLYVLSVAGVTNYLPPGWWMLGTGAANIMALAMFLSPPIRRWVAKRPAAVP